MFWYIIKRIALFIPTLIVATLIGFWLFSFAPSNPIDRLVVKSSIGNGVSNQQHINHQEKKWVNDLGLNLPVFYFSINTIATPDTIYKVYDKKKLFQYKQFLAINGQHQFVDNYFKALATIKNCYLLSVNTKNKHWNENLLSELEITIQNLELATEIYVVNYNYEKLIELNRQLFIFNHHQLSSFLTTIHDLQNTKYKYKNYIPALVWHGLNNQYHQWIFGSKYSKGILNGDFGISYSKKVSVFSILKEKLFWSLLLGLISILIAYAISVPLSFFLATQHKTIKHKITNTILFVLYCLPSYFVGVLLILLLANPDVLALFPPSGVKPIYGYTNDASFFDKVIQTLPYLILPLICYTYSSITLITKTLTTSIEQELTQHYITTAKAKGLPEKQIIQHAFKNSLLPIITLFSQLFPFVIGGSVIVESIFTIPGMGLETVKSIVSQDYPVVIGILTLSTLFTLISYLVADIVSACFDSRIILSSKND